MEYYILEVDKRYVAPVPVDWYGKLDAKTVKNAESLNMPNHTIFFVEENMQMVYTDVIKFPCFMVSKKIKDIVMLYDPSIRFERVIFFSKERGKSTAYYFPFLEEIDCLLEGSEFNKVKSEVKHARVEKEKLAGKSIIRIGGLSKTCILISMDLANSFLRRDTVGIGLRETESV